MSDSKCQDHWKALALLLDVSVPEEESVEDASESEHSDRTDLQAGLAPPAEDSSPEPEVLVGNDSSEPLEPLGLVEKPSRSSPAPRPSARRGNSHWQDVANELGIEVADEEAEEPEQLVVETESSVDWQPHAEVEPAEVPRSVHHVEVAEEEPGHRPPTDGIPGRIEASEPPWAAAEFDQQAVAEFAELADDDQPPTAPVTPSGRTIPSLFDDRNFSIDTPGALDRIFDEHWDEEERPAVPAGFEERDAYCDIDDDFEEGADLPSFEEDDGDAEGLPEAAAKRESDEGEEPRRRRRRRRRRRKTAKNGESGAVEEQAEPGASLSEDADDSALVDQDFAAVPLDGEHQDDQHEDYDEEDDEEDDDLVSPRVKHRKIPTWPEAVGIVISNNLESRAKNPGNGSRGRGRGRGRRS